MSILKEVLLGTMAALSPVWASLIIGAVCWTVRQYKREKRVWREARDA